MSLGKATIKVLILMTVLEFIFCSDVSGQQNLTYAERIAQKRAKGKNRLEKRKERIPKVLSNPDCETAPVKTSTVLVTGGKSSKKSMVVTEPVMYSLEADNIESMNFSFDFLFKYAVEISFSKYKSAVNNFLKKAEKWNNDLCKEFKAQIKTFQLLELQYISSKFNVAIKDEQLTEHNKGYSKCMHQLLQVDKEKYKDVYFKYEHLFLRVDDKALEMTLLSIMYLFVDIHKFCTECLEKEISRINSYKNGVKISAKSFGGLLKNSRVNDIKVVEDIKPEVFASALGGRNAKHTTADVLKVVIYYCEALSCILKKIQLAINILSLMVNVPRENKIENPDDSFKKSGS